MHLVHTLHAQMIKKENLIEVGFVQKAHGLKGELNVSVSDPVFDEVGKCPYLVCAVDGIFVPFFIEDYRWRSDSVILLKFEDIDSQEAAQPFCGQTLWFDRKCFTRKEAEAYDAAAEEEQGLIGYHVMDETLGDLGEIVDINDQTANILFIIDHEGEELMVPAADELILGIDDEARIVRMDLPAGLVNMDEAESEEEPFLKI